MNTLGTPKLLKISIDESLRYAVSAQHYTRYFQYVMYKIVQNLYNLFKMICLMIL